MIKYLRYYKTAALFIFPQLLVTLIFFIWPACQAVWQSLLFSDAFGMRSRFAGLQNFIDLFHSTDYLHAIGVTMVFSVAVTLITMSFGLGFAVLVHGRVRAQKFYKTMLIWPYAVAPAVAAILWRFLCHPTMGWLPYLLQSIGFDFNYVVHPRQALAVVIVTACWQQFSYNFLFYFAALKLIPKPLLEAAILDGASAWRRFWQITLPLLSPTTFFLLFMNLIYSFFDTFGIIHIMTRGGPESSTTTMLYKVYEDGFVGMDPGSSSAQSVILMVLVIAITLFQFRFLEKKVHYQ